MTCRFLIILVLVACLLMFGGVWVSAGTDNSDPEIPIFEDPSYSFEERAADLVARMTTAQKGSQMISEGSAAIPAAQLGDGALNVPATMGVNRYNWWNEALHGFARGSGSNNAVSYPQNLSVANTWNPELYYKQASLIGDEIRELARKVASGSNAGNALDLTFFSPTINLQRDPRWGRNEESYSEDPLLMTVMASQFVLGMEGKDQDGNPLDENGRLKTVTTIKHYTANNSERNRLDGGADVDLRALREYYTAPYRDVIQATDVTSLMTAYSTLNGEPCTSSSYLLDTLLRQTWGLSGYITSDCDSVSTIYRHQYINPHTGKVLTTVEQLAQALAHGTDLQCSGGHSSNVGTYDSRMSAILAEAPATDKGVFTENQLDISLHRLLTARMRLGEFDQDLPYTLAASERTAANQAADPQSHVYWQTSERLAVAEDVATEAVVMLQNNDNILPLDVVGKDSFKVVIVGEWQTSRYLGLYTSQQSNFTNHISIQAGITEALRAQNEKIEFIYITDNSLTVRQMATIEDADVAIVVAGTDQSYSAEDRDRTTIAFPNNQAALISQVGKLNDNTIAVLETCGPMQVSTFENDVAAILWSSYGGMRKGVGFGRIISGTANPSGKLTATWHVNVKDRGQSDITEITNYNLYKTEVDPGRTYMYFTGEVSYPFGYGLSFTNYEYSDLKVILNDTETTIFDANDTVTVSLKVQNSGLTAGQEVVQLYVAQPHAPAELQRPIKRLSGFDKIALEPGESKTVMLEVEIADLAFYNEEEDRYIIDTGIYEIQVGASSADIRLTSQIEVAGALNIVPAVLTAKPVQEGDQNNGIEERLIFDKGKVVEPQLTVAMNDESLYGFIITNQLSPIKQKQSVAYPDGMTFSFKSNRSEIVAVNGDEIRTVAPGVATITATATYNDESVSTDFVVYVQSSSYLDDIRIDGESIANFRSTIFNYSVELTDQDQIPVVEASYDNDDLKVIITQVTEVPGVVTIELYNTYNNETAVYRIGFGARPKSTSFADGLGEAQNQGWTFINGNDNANFSENGLTITAEPGAFGTEIAPQNLFVKPALGDWVIQTKVDLSKEITENGQQTGLIIYDNDQNYLTYALERVTVSSWGGAANNNVLRVIGVVAGVTNRTDSVNIATNTIYLQVIKQGNVYSFKYSLDGTDWSTLDTTANMPFALPMIGMWANKGIEATADFEATFDGIEVFEVSELYPRLTQITVDGQPLTNFERDQFAYNFEISEDVTNIPVIDGVPEQGHHLVTIDQMTGPTGQAVINVDSGAENVTYTVNYNYSPASEFFVDGIISDRWEILRDDGEYSLVKGMGIEMPTQVGDIYSTNDNWKNVFVASAMGNWEVVAKVHYPHKPTENYQQAMLLVWQDDDNYIRVNCQQDALRLEPGLEINGAFGGHGLAQAFAEAAEDGTVTLYFKINKSGLSYNASYSQDGINFFDLGTVENVDFANPKIGLYAAQNNANAAPMNVYWEYIILTNHNGVVQRTYPEMLQEAVDNTLNYVVENIPSEVQGNIEITVPHGYTVTFASSDPTVIDAEGYVTPQDQDIDLTVTVSDGVRSATSEVITVKVVQ